MIRVVIAFLDNSAFGETTNAWVRPWPAIMQNLCVMTIPNRCHS